LSAKMAHSQGPSPLCHVVVDGIMGIINGAHAPFVKSLDAGRHAGSGGTMASNSSTAGGLSPPSVLLLESSTYSQSSNIIAAWVVMMVLAAFTVSLRFYTRRFILRALALEDWLILVAMVLYIPWASPPPNCETRFADFCLSRRSSPLAPASALSVVSTLPQSHRPGLLGSSHSSQKHKPPLESTRGR